MAIESVSEGGTLRDRFVAAVARNDETAGQRLTADVGGPYDPSAQRDEAWRLLSAAGRWAARALDSVEVTGTDDKPISDSEAAFQRAQHLDAQLWELSQRSGFHDAVALLVESVKRALYHGADLGPVPGGRLGSLRLPSDSPQVVASVDPDPEDLRAIGSDLGEGLRWFGELRLGDPVAEAVAVLGPDAASG